MATERITLILHHKGFLGRQEGVLRYIGGEFCAWEGLDIDTINKFTVETLCKEHYYRRFEKIYWLKPGRDLEVGLRELEKDAHVVNMCNTARKNAGEIEIFFIHPIEQTPPVCRPSCPPVESPLQTPGNSPIHMMSDASDDYESVEDSAYKPSPIVSEDDDMDDSLVKKKSGIKSKTTPVKRKIGAASNDKGKGVAADASDEDEISVEEEIDVGSNVGNGEEDDGGVSGNKLKRSYADVICSRCGLSNHKSRTCTNVGVLQKPKKWTPAAQANPAATQPTQAKGTVAQATATNPAATQTNTAAQGTAQVGHTYVNVPAPNIIGGSTSFRPASKGNSLKNPPYRPPGLFPKSAFRPKLNTMRPPIVGAIVPPQATQPQSVNNSSTQQLPGQPSQGTINAASQGTRERLMKFIPTPRGPSTKPK
ncbi:proteoglycan 4-like [Sesbania bispinosa]|nr:proteoglycan 4-like [Sesbania bispinosa]